MKLFYQLFGYLMVVIVILLGLDGYFSYREEVKQFEADLVANATQDGRSLSGIIEHVWREDGEEKAFELLEDASLAGDLAIRLVFPEPQSGTLPKAPMVEEQRQKLAAGQVVSMKLHEKNGDFLYTYVPVGITFHQKAALEVRQPLVVLDRYAHRMLQRGLVVTSLLTVACGVILYTFMYYKIRVPLQRLTWQARRIGEGDFSADKGFQGDGELAELAGTMNDMCSRLLIIKEKLNFESHARLKTLEQLRHTERLSTCGLLSAGIAHEIGTPLNVVDGRAKMILSEDLDEQEVKACARIIQQQAERMTVIVRQLLDFTRRPKTKTARENICVLVRQVFQILYPMASKQHVSLSLSKTDDARVELAVDGSQMQQVLVNLVMNSIQAMPDGGTVDVHLSNERIRKNKSEGGWNAPFLKIRIIDEGEGICPENLVHLFTPFFTTKTVGTGTGLGLSIAHGIVEEHGGWITVERNLQHGACFSVYLPIKELDV